MIGNQIFKLLSQSQCLKNSNKLIKNLLFQTPSMTFSSSDGIKKVQEELQGESPFEINSSRQMMIADKKIVKGDLPPKMYNSRNRSKRGVRDESYQKEDRVQRDSFKEDRDIVKRERSFQNKNEKDMTEQGENSQEFNEDNQERQVETYRKDKYKNNNKQPYQQKSKGLTRKEIENVLPDLNNVRHYYKVLDRFTEQNFLDVVMNEDIISNPENVLALNNLWTYSRKNRIIHSYKTPQFQQITKMISENLDKLQVPESISGFSFNLYKVSIHDVEPFMKIEQHVLQNIEQYSLKSLAQLAFSFTSISRGQTEHDFSSFYGKMQVVIALKLRDAIVDPATDIRQLQKDYSQILSGYSKSQNLSKEFIYILEQFIVNHITHFQPREKTAALYTFATNDYFSKTLCEICRDDFLRTYDSFNIQEMSHLLISLDKFDMIDEEILKLVKQQFLLKSTQVNLLDLADVCSVFFKREFVDEEFFGVVRETYRSLRQNVDMNVIHKMLTNVSTLLNKELMPHRFFKTLMQSLQIVSFEKDLKGRFIDELKAEGKLILHPQFKQQFLETLDNQRKMDFKTMKTEEQANKKRKQENREKKHYQIEHKNRERDDRASGKKTYHNNNDSYHKNHKNSHDESD